MNSGTYQRRQRGYLNESWGVDHGSQDQDPYYLLGVQQARMDKYQGDHGALQLYLFEDQQIWRPAV